MKINHIISEGASTSSNSLFGGSSFKMGGGPSDHGTRKLGNWQSDNAWDIMAEENKPVYSLNDGTVMKAHFAPYNGVIYGWQITIRGTDNDIFYTHLSEKGPDIVEGKTIKKGDLIGIIGKPSQKWPTHVHIGIGPDGRRDDISKYMDKDGSIKGYSGQKSDDKISSSLDTSSTGGYKFKDPILANIMSGFDYITGLNEVKQDLINNYDYLLENKDYSDFGKNTYVTGKELIIPSNNNTKIKSPVSGIIDNLTYNSSCKNQIGIKFKIDKKHYHLEYCGIDNVFVTKGSKVNLGTKIGETNSNVSVSLFDSGGQKIYIDEIIDKPNNNTNQKLNYDKDAFHDPVLAGLVGLPGKFLNRIWASPTDKNQPSSWSQKWNPAKKVNENIERIKKLL